MKIHRDINGFLLIFLLYNCLIHVTSIYCQGVSWQKTFQAGEMCWGEKLFVNSDQNIDFFSRYSDGSTTYMMQKRYSSDGVELNTFTYELDEFQLLLDVGIDNNKNVFFLYKLNTFNSQNQCLKKFEPNGNYDWSVTFPWDYHYMSIAFDRENQLYAAGYHHISETQLEAFVTKFDESGDTLWLRTFTYGDWTKIYINSISIDNNNNICITGHTGWVQQDIFIAKFDPDGNIVWDKTLGTSNDDEGWCVANDQDNNVIVYGYVNRPWVSYVNTGWIGKFNTDGDSIFVNTTYQGQEIGGPMYPVAIKTDINNNIYIAGSHGCPGFVAKYDPGGTKLWEFMPLNWNASIEDIPVYIDVDLNENLYFIGDSSTQAEGNFVLLGKVDPYISGIDDENLPGNDFKIREFRLSQNYPNPFNLSTTIAYSISNYDFVSMKIYNIVGQQVGTLVNEVKEPGQYEVHFDASKLSTGIYFYRLNSGNFNETKKMLLIK